MHYLYPSVFSLTSRVKCNDRKGKKMKTRTRREHKTRAKPQETRPEERDQARGLSSAASPRFL